MKLTEREKKYLKDDWELLRRNEVYKIAYKIITKKCGQVNIWDPSLSKKETDRILRVFAFLGIDRISTPIDPALTFEDLVNHDSKKGTQYIRYLNKPAVETDCELNEMTSQEVFKKKRRVAFYVDFRRTREEIREQFDRLLSEWIRRVKKADKEIEPTRKFILAGIGLILERRSRGKILTLKNCIKKMKDLNKGKELVSRKSVENFNKKFGWQIAAGVWKDIDKKRTMKPFTCYSRARGDKEKYRRVFDLKSSGKSWEQIASKEYKGEAGGSDRAKQKAYRDYRRCKALIDMAIFDT